MGSALTASIATNPIPKGCVSPCGGGNRDTTALPPSFAREEGSSRKVRAKVVVVVGGRVLHCTRKPPAHTRARA